MPIPLMLLAISLAAVVLPSVAWAQAPDPGRQKSKMGAQLIASAMSAAPRSISQNATISVMDGDKMRTLRPGKGEYTCVPEDSFTPGKDPMCLDRNAME